MNPYDVLMDTVLACLRAHGITLVGPAGSTVTAESFARDVAANATMALQAEEPCAHELVEALSVNGRDLEGYARRCAECGEDLGSARTDVALDRLRAEGLL